MSENILANATSINFSKLPELEQELCKEIVELIIKNIMHCVSLFNLFILLEVYTKNVEVKNAAKTSYTLVKKCRIRKLKLLQDFCIKYKNANSLTNKQLRNLYAIRNKELNVNKVLKGFYSRLEHLLALDKNTMLEKIVKGAKEIKEDVGKVINPFNISLTLVIVALGFYFLYVKG